MSNRASQAHRKLAKNVALPIMLLVAVMICVVIAIVFFIANLQTKEAIERQRELAQGMIGIRLGELEKVVNDYAHWDDALDNLVIHPNLAWAEDNVGPSIKERYGIDATFVIDSAGRTTYGMTNGTRSIVPPDRIMSPGFDKILRQRMLKGPDGAASGLALASGRPALVSVAPLRPFYNQSDITRTHRSILAFVDLLDEAELKRLSTIYRLPDLHIESGNLSLQASVDVTTSDSNVPVRLAWTGDNPGARLIDKLMPPLLVLLAAFAGMLFFVLYQGSSLLRNLRNAEESAARDILTGLLNRSILLQDLDAMTKKNGLIETHSLFYLDLDGFKAVNDTFGHEVGDKVLCETARCITENLPDGAVAYRLGGDEFAVLLLYEATASAMRNLAARIIVAISKPMMIGDVMVRIGATIGIATAPKDGRSPIELIRHADEALYTGKREQKGCVRFYMQSIDCNLGAAETAFRS